MSGFAIGYTNGVRNRYGYFVRGPPVYASGRKALYPRLVNRHKNAYRRLGLGHAKARAIGKAAASIGRARRRKRASPYRAANTIKRLFRATRARGKRSRFGVRG